MRIDEMGASKSAKKREFLALQELGERLVGLSEEQLRSMGLERNLLEAVSAAAGMKSRGALRRQCQLIGKLMRHVDPEPIRQALETLQRQEKAAKETFRRAEYWRDRIVQKGYESLNEFFELTGNSNESLSSTLDDYVASSGDSTRKALRRKIFRQVLEDLTVQNSAR